MEIFLVVWAVLATFGCCGLVSEWSLAKDRVKFWEGECEEKLRALVRAEALASARAAELESLRGAVRAAARLAGPP